MRDRLVHGRLSQKESESESARARQRRVRGEPVWPRWPIGLLPGVCEHRAGDTQHTERISVRVYMKTVIMQERH
ncbi:hypothetical protein GN956_G9191 [Arapaima gigas]